MGRARRGFGNSAQNGLCQHCFVTKIAFINEGLIRNASSCFRSSPTRVRSSSLGGSRAAIVAAKYCCLDRSIFSFCSITALDITGITPSISWPGNWTSWLSTSAVSCRIRLIIVSLETQSVSTVPYTKFQLPVSMPRWLTAREFQRGPQNHLNQTLLVSLPWSSNQYSELISIMSAHEVGRELPNLIVWPPYCC